MRRTKELIFHAAIFLIHDSYQTRDINVSLTKESGSSVLTDRSTQAILVTLWGDAKEVLGSPAPSTDSSL